MCFAICSAIDSHATPDAFLRDVLAKPRIFVIGTEDELAKPRRAKPRNRRT